MNRYVAYSDESYITAERYRSIASFSFPERFHPEISQLLKEILQESNVSEFKWEKLKTARLRFCALKMIKALPVFIQEFDSRLDIIIWDTHDKRHSLNKRDDHANYGRMYFHLINHAARIRGKDTDWKLYPDEKLDVDWDSANRCLSAMGFKEFRKTGKTLYCCEGQCRYYISELRQIQSHKCTCCQVADLLAGLSVFSIKELATYRIWERQNENNLLLFPVETDRFSNRQEERCSVLHDLYNLCKNKKYGVSLDSHLGLKTPNPQNPINFWHYIPQHILDKAPTR